MKFLEGPEGSLYYVDIGFNDLLQPNPAAIRRDSLHRLAISRRPR